MGQARLLQHRYESNGACRKDSCSTLIPLSAISGDRLTTLAKSCVNFLAEKTRWMISAITAARHETVMRIGLRRGLGSRRSGRALAAYLTKSEPRVLASGEIRQTETGPRWFVFSGQGPQWWGMGQRLWTATSLSQERIEECDRVVRDVAGWSLVDVMSASESENRGFVRRPSHSPDLCVQIALADVWKLGYVPVATIGHSVGEIAGHMFRDTCC